MSMSGVSESRLTVWPYLIAITVFFISVMPVFAQVNFSDDEAAFLAAYPGLSHQDFSGSSVAPVSQEICPAPANSTSDNVCFSPGDILPGIEFLNGPIISPPGDLFLVGTDFTGPGTPPGPALNEGSIADNLEIVFDPGVTRVGLTLGCIVKGPCDADAEVVIFDANNFFLDSITVHVTSDFNTFLGISSQTPIGNISLRNPDTETFLFKGVLNVWFGNGERNVPTLSEWGMISAVAGLGLIGVFFAVRRRRASLDA